MHTQFFGNYLLSRNIVTSEQLIDAIIKTSANHVKLYTLAIYHNMMSSVEVNDALEQLAEEGKDFNEVAIERHYLTEDQISQLIASPGPDYLLLGQILVEDGIITFTDLEDLILDYESDDEIYDLDMEIDQKAQVLKLLRRHFNFEKSAYGELRETYLLLLFNNLVRLIGADFTPLTPIHCQKFDTHFCVLQHITGEHDIVCAIDMDEKTAVSFASRFANSTFQEFNEFVQASLSDFINLHNGLFMVNLSNNSSVDLQLSPPEELAPDCIEFAEDAYTHVFPVLYPFGTVNFILSQAHSEDNTDL